MKAIFSTITAIVPSYNEGSRIVAVVTALKAAKHVSEIIVVDDGGDKNSHAVLAGLPVKLITHKHNKGKAQAVLTGLEAATSKVVLLIDADLTGITPKVIDDMIEKYWLSGCDLLLGDRTREAAPNRYVGMSLAFTGERICKKAMLLSQPSLFAHAGCDKGYLIVPIMNDLYFGNKKIGKFVLLGVGQTYKSKKRGWLGFYQDLKLHINYLQYLGITKYVNQCTFARNLI